MNIKVSKYKFNIHSARFSVRKSNSATHLQLITAYVMHISNTLSLISARNNRKQKFQQRFFQSTLF